MSITIKVLFFAGARDAIGESESVLTTNTTKFSSQNTLNQFLIDKFPLLKHLNYKIAINEEYIEDEEIILQNDSNIAIIPPLSGG